MAKNKEVESNSGFAEKLWSKTKWGIVAIVIVFPFFPNFFPLHPIDGFWFINGTVFDWIQSSYYLFLWAIAINLINIFFLRKDRSYDYTPKEVLKKGLARSVVAGVWEELAFRWIVFLGCMVTLYISNWILFGFKGESWGIVQWFNNLIKAPIADYLTFGLLHDHIMHTKWYFGAAIILSNGLFRDGHRYQGFVGFVNSWFGGMFLFFTMFRYGLVAAIFVHIVYDILCYGVAFIEVLFFRMLTGVKAEEIKQKTPLEEFLKNMKEKQFQN